MIEVNGIPTIGGMNFSYHQWTQALHNVRPQENGYIAMAGRDLALFDNKNNGELDMTSIHNKTKKSHGLPTWGNDFKLLKLTKDYLIMAVKYTGTGTWGGVQLPDSNGAAYWFVYTDYFDNTAGQITINNISTHHITNVVEHAYLSNVNSGTFVHQNNIAVSYVVIDDVNNIPAIDTDVRTWNLWTVSSNFTEYDVTGVGFVKEDELGRKYVDIAPYDQTAQTVMNMRVYFVAQSNLAINTNTKQILNIFPNPATSNFSIKTQDLGIAKIVVYQSNGQAVISQNYQGQNQVNIDVAGLSQGVYFVKVFDNNGNVHHLKLIKE